MLGAERAVRKLENVALRRPHPEANGSDVVDDVVSPNHPPRPFRRLSEFAIVARAIEMREKAHGA